jgi:hypothetical protein
MHQTIVGAAGFEIDLGESLGKCHESNPFPFPRKTILHHYRPGR